MGRHREVTDMDYFERRAAELEQEQMARLARDPVKDDDLSRHLKELDVRELINNFRLISETYVAQP
jgi:hypothetical protein